MDDFSGDAELRIRQIKDYEWLYGYPADSDHRLLFLIIQRAEHLEWMWAKHWEAQNKKWHYKLMHKIDSRPNPYTCRLFKRIEFAIYWLTLKHPYWSEGGRLCRKHHELPPIFPGKWYRWASKIQNKYFWSRLNFFVNGERGFRNPLQPSGSNIIRQASTVHL